MLKNYFRKVFYVFWFYLKLVHFLNCLVLNLVFLKVIKLLVLYRQRELILDSEYSE